jgi:cytochrome c-type biogenesis protein CcmH/NrfG
VSEERVSEETEATPWQQRTLDNLWLLIAISVVVPGVLYLGWGLWEIVELPTWGGQ